MGLGSQWCDQMAVKYYRRKFFCGAESSSVGRQVAGKHLKAAPAKSPTTLQSLRKQQQWEESAACFNLSQSLLQSARKSAASLKGQRAYFNPHTWLSLPRCLQREHSQVRALRMAFFLLRIVNAPDPLLWLFGEFCIAIVHSQQMGRYLPREPRATLV